MVSQDVRRTLVCRAFDKGFKGSTRALIGFIDKLKVRRTNRQYLGGGEISEQLRAGVKVRSRSLLFYVDHRQNGFVNRS